MAWGSIDGECGRVDIRERRHGRHNKTLHQHPWQTAKQLTTVVQVHGIELGMTHSFSAPPRHHVLVML